MFRLFGPLSGIEIHDYATRNDVCVRVCVYIYIYIYSLFFILSLKVIYFNVTVRTALHKYTAITDESNTILLLTVVLMTVLA